MTIAVDTDDIEGLIDAHRIISIMTQKYVSRSILPNIEASFGKIEFIKMLRKFGSIACDNYENDEEFKLEHIKSLRFTKTFADEVWRTKRNV